MILTTPFNSSSPFNYSIFTTPQGWHPTGQPTSRPHFYKTNKGFRSQRLTSKALVLYLFRYFVQEKDFFFCINIGRNIDLSCKTDLFLRGMAKRLIVGSEPQFSDVQERLAYIFHKQLYGVAITELTSLLSRRGVHSGNDPFCWIDCRKAYNLRSYVTREYV